MSDELFIRIRPRGFSLIETIVAVVILAVAVPSMLITIRDAHVRRANPYLASRARWLAADKLESIIADRHSVTRGWSFLDVANYPDEVPVATAPGFGRTVDLTETQVDLVTPGSGYMVVDVRVTWTDATATPRELTVSTVLTEYTP